MFNKTAKSTATDKYIENMISAVLEELSGMRVYLTQSKLKYGPLSHGPVDPEEDHVLQRHRPYANRWTKTDFEVLYTSLDSPRRFGREGQFPILPRAEGHVLLTSETNGFIHWDMLRIDMCVFDGIGAYEHGRSWMYFSKEKESADNKASPELVQLSEELRHRRPTKLGYAHE